MSTTERSRTSARRESLLGDQPGAFASARYVRITPMKARRVVDMVRGLQVDEALTLLQFAPQAASETVYKVLESAVANAGTTEGLDAHRIQPFYAGLLARACGVKAAIAMDGEKVVITAQ